MIEGINRQNALNAYNTYYNNLQALNSRLCEDYMATGQKLVMSQKQALEVALRGILSRALAASWVIGLGINFANIASADDTIKVMKTLQELTTINPRKASCAAHACFIGTH
jgi:hypothetical protein